MLGSVQVDLCINRPKCVYINKNHHQPLHFPLVSTFCHQEHKFGLKLHHDSADAVRLLRDQRCVLFTGHDTIVIGITFFIQANNLHAQTQHVFKSRRQARSESYGYATRVR